MAEGHRGGGYCRSCGRANWAVISDGESFRSFSLFKQAKEIRQRKFLCGWCFTSLSSTVFQSIPDDEQARRAIAEGEAIVILPGVDPEPKSGQTYAESDAVPKVLKDTSESQS